MPDYTAPVADSLFVLRHVAPLERLRALPAFAEASDDLVESVVEEAGRMAAEVFAPINQSGDRDGVRIENDAVVTAAGFADAYRQFAEAGWLSLAQSPEFGGQGLPFALHVAVSEYFNSANLSLALCPMLSVSAIDALTAHGTPEMQQRYLGRLISGEWTGTMNLTEPQAGSDLAAVQARAVPAGDHYRVSGQKIYISWGDHDMADNILHLVLARLPDAPPGVKGISLFLVPKYLSGDDGAPGERNDAYPVSVEHKMGIHASPTCVMAYGARSDGAVGYLVGEPNDGLACMFTMMNHARLEVGLEGVALGERAYQAAAWYAKDRRQGRAPGTKGQAPIVRHADVRRMLLTMRALTEAGRALTIAASLELDLVRAADDAAVRAAASTRLGVLTPIVKGWCTEIAQEITSLGIQVHGGMGYVEETGVAQYYRDARITSIYEGTNGIQAGDLIGRKTLRDGGQGMRALVAEMRETAASLAASESAALNAQGAALGAALDELDSALEHILAAAGDEAIAGAAAFDYLMLAGTVAGGWLMARAALAATGLLAGNPSGRAMLEAKLVTAQFYAERILPRAAAYAAGVRAPATTLTTLPEEAF